MKKMKTQLIVSLLLALFSSSLFALNLKSADELNGSWLLDYTKRSKDDSEKSPMGITWEFKNNELVKKGITQARETATYDTKPVPYTVEGGVLKISVLGRAGKVDVYSLEEKSATSMVLKDTKFGSYMFFTKK